MMDEKRESDVPDYIIGDGVAIRKLCAICLLLDPPDDHRHADYDAEHPNG